MAKLKRRTTVADAARGDICRESMQAGEFRLGQHMHQGHLINFVQWRKSIVEECAA